MDILLKNGNFILYDETIGDYTLYQGNMIICGDRIYKTDISDSKNSMDIAYRLVSPIYINAHLHLGETIYRPLPHKMSLLDYLDYTESINAKFKDKSEDKWRESADITLQESISAGGIIVNTIRGDRVLGEYPVIAFSGYPVMKSKKLSKYIDHGIEGFREFYESCKKRGIVAGVFMHSLYRNDIDSMNLVRDILDEYDTYFTIHLAEDEASEDEVVKIWGDRTIAILDRYHLISDKTILVHGNTLKDEELDIVASKGATVVVCPKSNDNLLHDRINVNRLILHKVNWCIASDGLATGEVANLLSQAMDVVERDGISFREALASITIYPARTFKMEEHILRDSGYASFVVYDTKDITQENYMEKLFSKDINISDIYNKGKRIK